MLKLRVVKGRVSIKNCDVIYKLWNCGVEGSLLRSIFKFCLCCFGIRGKFK